MNEAQEFFEQTSKGFRKFQETLQYNDLSDYDDTLLGIGVTHDDDPFSYSSNRHHNTLIYFIHKDTSEITRETISTCIDKNAIVEQRDTPFRCRYKTSIPLFASALHCGFNDADLDAGAKSRIKEVIDALASKNIIRAATAKHVYEAFSLGAYNDIRPDSQNGEKRARY